MSKSTSPHLGLERLAAKSCLFCQ